MNEIDVLIIGNGILGISTAYALTLEEPNLKVAVVGPNQCFGAGSLASGAMLNCFAEISKFTLKAEHSRARFKIARQASNLWPNWINQINSELQISDRITITPGTFVLLNARSGSRENENFAAILDAAQQYQEPYEEVDPSNIPGIYPTDDSRPLRALFLPNEGSLDSHQLLGAIKKVILKTNKVILLDTWVDQILLDKEKITGVRTRSGDILQASTVLVTAGAYSQILLEQIPSLKSRIPKILAGVGCSLILKADKHQFRNVVRSPNRAGSCGIHILPSQNNPNLLYIGASNDVSLTPKTTPRVRDTYYLLERAMEQFNQDLHKAEIIEWRLGNRPMSFDTFPLIGATSITGLWLLTGTYRDGLHSSPLLASSIAREILGKSPLFEHNFQPERFPIEVMTKNESIVEFADQYLSAGYEHGMKLPKLSWNSEIKEMIYKRMEFIYDTLEIDIGLSPDLLFMFHQREEMIPIFKEYYQSVKQEFSSLNKKILTLLLDRKNKTELNKPGNHVGSKKHQHVALSHLKKNRRW